jgi:SAM-dependent methyltransferase
VNALACPVCHEALQPLEAAWSCTPCDARYAVKDGINRFLPLAREAYFAQFLADYTTVRLGEGRASDDPEYFRRLPEPTPGGPMEQQWTLRSRSWRTVRNRVIVNPTRSLDIVDVGAGVGWLSNRLTELGHSAHAVDLTIDNHDGLGAARHFPATFARSQAEMDALPIGNGAVDMVIYNASLHYSSDYVRTLTEALRVLRLNGAIVVMDSPIYRHRSTGDAMLAERHADFEQRFGSRSDSVKSVGYLTPAMLGQLSDELGVRWTRHHTWYGWRWAWKPWRARLTGRRQPSRFVVLVGRRSVPR